MKKILLIILSALFFLEGYAQAPDSWAQKADFNADPVGWERAYAVGFSINGKGYLGTGSGYLNDFWEYDPGTNVWTQKANVGGMGRRDAVGFSINGKGYIGLGFRYNGSFHFLNDFWEYDPVTNLWTQKPNFGGTARTGAAGFSINGKGYIGTGLNSSYFKDFWEYDPTTNLWTQKTDFPSTARNQAVGFSIKGKGYLGTGGDDSFNYTDFWEYDPTTNLWTQKTNFSGYGRAAAVGFSINSKGYIGTGYVVSLGARKDFWEYDPATNLWTQKVDFGGTARYGAVGFSINGKAYIGTGSAKDFWEYTPTPDISTPTITSFTPDNGYTGSSVTITGTGFTGTTAVTLGGTNVASFTVDDDSHITAIVGAGITGTVSVTTPGGNGSSAGTFTYNGYITIADGNWNTGATWLGGNVPAESAAKTLNHAVSINSPVTNSGAITANTYFNIYSTFTNNGSTTINGSLQMGDGGVFVNNGTISYGTSGTLGYYNSVARTTGDEFPAVNGPNILLASNLGGVTLHASRSVNYLQVNAGKLTLGDNNITVEAINYSTPANYIVTNGTGTLTLKNISSAPKLFPVGPSATSYNPITISNGGGDDFSVRVQSAFTNPPLDASKVVNAQWTISKTGTQTGNNVTLTAQWNASDEAGYPTPTFDRNGSIVIGHYGSSSWDEIPATAVSGAGPYTTTVTGVSSFSPFGVGNMRAFAVSAYVTASDGNWSDGSTWVGGNVPPVGASVIINHIVTMDVSPVVNSGDSIVVNGTLNCGYNTVSGTGSAIINGIVKTPNGAGFSGTSNTSFSNSLSSLTLGSSSTVEYNGVFSTVISENNYANLTSSSVGGRLLPQGRIGISGVFTRGSNTWGTLYASSTVEFNGNVPQNIPAIPYDNLSVSNGGTKTLSGAIVAGRNITIGVSTSLDASPNNYSISLAGDWLNNGTFTAGTGTVSFNGTASQAIEGSSITAFSNLAINNNSVVGLGQDIEIDGTLHLQGGNISTGANKVIVGGTGNINGGGPSNHIDGTLQRHVNTGNSSVFFPIGDLSTYLPVTLDFSGVTTAGDITSSVSPFGGDHPSIGTSSLDANKSVNRYWALNSNTIAGGTYDATFEFNPGDIDGEANPDNFIIGKYSEGTWSYPTQVDIGITTTKATGISGFGDFAIADAVALSMPVVTSFTPDNGYSGTSVTIAGTGFTGATTVTIGGTNVASFTVDDDSNITAIVGTGITGTVNVTTPGGTASSATNFTYNGYVTAADGDWSDGATWLGGNVPPDGASVIINHIVTMDVSPVVNSGDSIVVNGTLNCGYNTVGGTGNAIINGIIKTPNGAGFSGTSNASFSNTLSSLTLGPSSTVEYNGVFSTIISENNYANLTSSSVGGRLLPQRKIGISGVFTPGSNTWGTIYASSTVEFNGNVPQNIPAIFYDNLLLSNTGIKNLSNTADSTVVGGNITIGSGSTLNASRSLYIKGNWINDGSYLNNNSFVIFNGVTSQTITGTYPTTFKDLLVSNEAGIYLNKDLRIASGGRLVFGNEGTKLHTGTNRVVMETGAINNIDNNPTTYIHGSLQMSLSSSDSYTTKYFKIGDATTYCPVTIDFLDVNGSQDIVVTPSEPGDHPNINASALNANKSVNRYWKITNDYLLSFAGTYDVTFEFSTADIDAGANPANFKIGMYSEGTWTYPTTIYIDATHIKAIGISGFGDFAIAEGACTEPPPAPSASGAAICKYSNASLFASGIGTIGWYDAPSGGNWLGGGTNFITGTVSSNTTYYVQDSTCQASATRTPVIVTVSAPVVIASASNTIVCQGTPVTLYGGGATSYSWSNGGGVFGINDGTPFTPLYTDTYFVSGADEAGCYGSAQITVIVNPSITYYQDADGDGFGNPSVSIQSCTQPPGYVIDNTDCDDTKLLYADNDGDGYGAGEPVACGVANNTDCDDNDPNVYPYLPSVNINGDFNPAMGICEGVLTTFTATPFYGGNAPSYQWKKNNINVGSNSNTYNDASLADADIITCELTSNATCATNTTALSNSIFMSVHPLPVVSAGTYPTYTTNDPPFALSGTPAGGSFSGPGVTGAGNMFDPSIPGAGDHTIIYYYADGNGCGNSASTTIHVTNYTGCTSAPMIGNITGSTTACGIAGTATTASYAIDNIVGATYSWTKSSSLIQIVSGQNTNSINATFSNSFSSGTITVTVTNACGSTARVISISKKTPATPGTISGITNPCAYVGTPVTYSIKQVAGATSYTWTVPAGVSIVGKTSPYTSPDTSINVIYLSSFTSNIISVTAANPCGTSAARNLTITNKVPAIPGVISGPTDVCDFIGANANVTYTINKVANATSYEWIIPDGVNIISTNISDTSIVLNFPDTYTTGAIQVKAKSGCGDGAYRSLTVAKKLPGTPGVISGPTDVCDFIGANANVTYTINKVANATSYEWIIPAGVNIMSTNVNDTSIVLNFPDTYTIGAIQVKAKRACGDGAYRSLTVAKKLAGTPGVITATGDICSSMYTGTNTVTYTIPANTTSPLPTSYVWTLVPTISQSAEIVSGSGVVGNIPNLTVETTGLSIQIQFYGNYTGGTLSVVAKRSCGTSSVRKLTLTKNVPSTPAISVLTGTICSGTASSVFYTTSSQPNTDYYIWSSPAGTKIEGSETKSPTRDTTTYNTIVIDYPANFTSGNLTVKGKSVCGISTVATLAVSSQPCSILSKNIQGDVEISQEQTTAVIYPNPNDGDFMLKIKSANRTDNAQIEITDITGRPIGKYTISNNNGNMLLHVNNKSFAAGAHILKYKIGNEVKFLKFIIQK